MHRHSAVTCTFQIFTLLLLPSCNAVDTSSTDVEETDFRPLPDSTLKEPITIDFSVLFLRYLLDTGTYLLPNPLMTEISFKLQVYSGCFGKKSS